jgi:hypothetical protein
MAAINRDLPTLNDQAKRMDPNGAIAHIVEVLTQRNPVLEDMVWQEGNLPTGHRFTSRTALPSIAWRRFNEGILPSKSKTDQVDETCGMLEAMSVIDVQLAKLNGNEVAFRASEDRAFLQAMNNEMEYGMFYHSTKDAPEKFMGLTPRYFHSSQGPAQKQVIKCHSSAADADQHSMWLVCWGPDTIFGIYPKGSNVGIEYHDMGKQIWSDAANKKFLAYVMNWNWKMGLCVKDFRYAVRIANIDDSILNATGATEDTLIPAMIHAYSRLPDYRSGRSVFYCNVKVWTYLWLQARNAVKNSTLAVREVEGSPVLTFQGIPIRKTDGLLMGTEALVG